MNIRFDGKTVAVTGGAKGIGAATAAEFSAAGARVVILDIDRAGADTARSLGASASFVHVDVCSGESVAAAFSTLAATHRQLDVLVNNAGIQTYGTLADTSEELWDRTLGINLRGQFLCAKHALPLLLKTEKPVIINVSSVNGIGSQANGIAYVTSKAGIIGMTQAIAVDYAPKLRCLAICPGAVNTPMMQADYDAAPDKAQFMREVNGIHLLGRMAEPVEIARAIVFAASPFASFSTGHYIRIDGGIGIKI